MNNVKCDCGHVNPHGTIFCEACGKPFEHEDTSSNDLLNMRYEGSARRSQTYNRTIIDRIWNFFSSVKVGVWLIIVTLVASALGTILPQAMNVTIPFGTSPAQFYKEEFGALGTLFYSFGFHDLYGSWWYIILVASLGVSLVICSLDRVVPLYKALKKQGITRHDSFMQRQRLFGQTTVELTQDSLEGIVHNLKKKRYNVRTENGNVLAEKGRFSRWGPYVNHVGLIILLIGVMTRSIPGFYVDDVLWIREGETKAIPGTKEQFYLKNEEFIMEVYGEDEEDKRFEVGMGMPSNYQTNAILYKPKGEKLLGEKTELEKVKEYKIKVNYPLKFNGYALYQTDYKPDEFYKMSFDLKEKASGQSFGNLTVDLSDPKEEYDLGNGYKVKLVSYFPDFYFNAEGDPDTKTNIPNNPVFIFNMMTPNKPDGEVSVVGIKTNLEPLGENQYKMSFVGLETRDVSGLVVRKDYSLGIIMAGAIIFMIGVIQGMYWNHRRIWIKQSNGDVLIAAHTNKNWYSLSKEITGVLEGTNLIPPKDLENQTDVEEKDAT